MNLQILVSSECNRHYVSRWGSSQKTSREQTRRHKPCPHLAGFPSQTHHAIAALHASEAAPTLAPGLACLTHWRPPPSLSLSPSTQKGSNFLLHFLPRLLGPEDSASHQPVLFCCFHVRINCRERGTERVLRHPSPSRTRAQSRGPEQQAF